MNQAPPHGWPQDPFSFLLKNGTGGELLPALDEIKTSHFQEMFDALPAAIYVTDAQGRLMYFNPAAIEFSGRVPALGVDEWCVTWKLYYADGTPMPHDACPMAIALKEGRVVRGVEAIAERPDGTRVWFEPFPTPLHDSQGRIIGGINMLVDISERKQAERERAMLASIVQSSGDAIVSKTLDGVITSWNAAAERLFGYTAAEAIGQSILLIIPPERQHEEQEILARLRRGERVSHYDTVRMTRDGRRINISLNISPMRDAAGHIIGASKIARDITDRKQAEQALHNLNALLEQRVEERTAELARSNRELDQFAYVASHDLKAPLRAITMLSDWIRQDVGDILPPTSREHLDKLQRRIKRMDTLLSDLLAYSRASRQRHKPQRVESAVLMRQVVELLDLPPTFAIITEEPMPVLETEQVALEIVLRNLIDNAFKHHHQPAQGHVWVAAQEQGEWVAFAVTDDGPGIDEQFHERIFSLFHTLRPRDEVEGSGIGLALVKRLVEMRGGTIAVESAAGHGATFRFTWPKSTAPQLSQR